MVDEAAFGDWCHHIPFFQGVVEYSGFINRVNGEVDPKEFSVGVVGAEWYGPQHDMGLAGTPPSMPCLLTPRS